jgi:hypothetical protein
VSLIGGCGFFLASRRVLCAADYQGLLCVFEYMIEAHCLGFQLGRVLVLSGIGAAQAARIVNVGRCLAVVMHEVIRGV